MVSTTKTRCTWCHSDPLNMTYHDKEWGVPIYDDKKLFEFLILEGMQAGLSWITILKKREAFRAAFLNFEPKKIAQFNRQNINALLKNEGIIRHKLKIESAISNAKAFLALKEKGLRFSDYIWNFVDGAPIQNRWKNHQDIPAKTEISEKMSKDLKKQGFKFVGSTICYAFMQAVGMVNDHIMDCFRYRECKQKCEKR
jgi:DNA-3-methyladenine glycosylase I